MVKIYYVLIASFLFAYFAQTMKAKKQMLHDQNIAMNQMDTIIMSICVFVVFTVFTLYAGLRTKYNDTITYIGEFNSHIGTDLEIIDLRNLFKQSYYGFFIWQTVIKHFNDNVHVYLFVTSMFVNFVYIRFYWKYSKSFALTVLTFIIINPFTFSMAAIKQSLAMVIALVGIECLLNNKRIAFVILVLIASRFHPFINLLLTCLLFTDKVWSGKMIGIIVATVAACIFVVQVLSVILSITEGVGVGYTVEELTHHTINPLRVVADCFPVYLSFKFRKEINEKQDKLGILSINMMTIQGLMTFASLFANPIYIYRTGLYFSMLEPIAIPFLLKQCIPERMKYKNVLCIGFFVVYTLLFLYDFGAFDLSSNMVLHTTIDALFR